MSKFIKFRHGDKDESVVLNTDHIIYALPEGEFRTEVRYMTYRLDVYHANVNFDMFSKWLMEDNNERDCNQTPHLCGEV